MHSGPLYKVKHQSGRILGPLDQERIRKLIQKNQITGLEIAKAYPVGDWQDINRFPELAELLLRHASGNHEGSKGTLKSEQSSYQPILSPAQDPFAATVVLPQIQPATGAESLVQTQPADSDATRVETEDQDKTWVDSRPVEETKTVQVPQEQKFEMESSSSGEVRGTELQIVPGQNDLALDFPDVLADPKYKKLLTEATIFVNRPGLEPAKKKFKVPPKKELFRIIAISAALGYFGYDSFLKDDPSNSAAKFLQKSEAFRPTIPKNLEGKKADPALSQSLYAEGMKYFALDHVQGYKAAAARFSQAIQSDPESVKASAMLASAYINLIDTSTKDENFFSVISKLIDTAKAKGNDIPEIVIAEVEFLTATGRPDAAVQRIVSYTKGRPAFDPSLFVYISEALLAKGNAKEASRYIQNFPDNQVWSPRIFFLRGRISEELGDLSGATENFDKALKGWPVHAKSRLRKVYLAWQAGTISKSEEDLLLLLKHPDFLSPRDLGQANYFLSQYYSVKQNFEGALSAIRRALTLDRQNRDYLLEYYTLLGREGGSVPEAKVEAKMYLFLSEGEKLIKQGKPNEALNQFLNARTENPKSTQPLVKIGDMFVQLNDLVNARMNYQKAAEMDPNNIDIWSKYISVLIQSYEWDEAQKAMNKFREAKAGLSSIDKAAGDMYAKQGRFQEAALYYQKAMSRDSIDPDVYIAYGKILMAVKKYKDAPFFFSLARRFDPLNTEPTILTAKAAVEVEGPDAGIQFLQDELQKGTTARAELLAALAEIEIKKGQWAAAQNYVDQARQANPEYAYPWKLQAKIYLNDENTDKKALDRALDAFKSYSDRNASDPSGYLERYTIFMKKSQFEKAEAELEKIYVIYPKYPNLHLYKGIMYSNMSNHKVAAEEYASELKNNPNSVSTLISLGRTLLELGAPKDALTHLAKAMAIEPQNPTAKMYAAVANHGLKNYQGAIALFKAAIQLDTGNPLAYKRMGECYRDMGDLGNARTAFQKYLQMEPDASDKAEIERYL